jgi:hypothetical protein
VKSHRYVKFPELWITVLNSRRATGADWKVAADLLRLAKFSRSFKYANVAATKRLQISRQTKNRSLDRLATWGLITINNRLGKSPVVRLLWEAQWQPRNV